VIDGPDGDGVLERIRSGVVKSMSIGYKPVKFDFEESSAARFGVVRHLRKLELDEVSLVLRPMNPAATIDTGSVKSMLGLEQLSDDQVQTLRDLHAEIGARLRIKSEQPKGDDDELEDPDPATGDGDDGSTLGSETGGEGDNTAAPKAAAQDPAATPPADSDAPDTGVLDRLRLARLGARFTSPTQEA
jgi:hypothetical protein